MKICTLTGSISRNAGGFYQSVRRLAQSLAACPGVEVTVLSCPDEFSAEDLVRWEPLNPTLLRSIGPRGFRFVFNMPEALTNFKSDLIHCHGLWLYQSWANLSQHRSAGTPYLISPRGMLDPWTLRESRLKKRIAGWMYENAHLQKAACLHALCESEARAIRAYGLKNPIAIIPNGIDLPEARIQKSKIKSAPWERLIEPGRKVLLFLSRIHPKKGLVNLLRAWSDIRKSEIANLRSEEWVLVIAGWDQGGHEAELKRLAKEIGLLFADVREQRTEDGSRSSINGDSPSVLFVGPQFGEDKEALFRNCDAFVLPSHSEGLPMAVLEAWGYGKPVLMTPECNLPEGFAAEAAIRIAPSEEGIEQGLRELIRIPFSALSILGDKGRQLAASQFAWPKIAADMRSVYEWVLGGGSQPHCVIR